MRVAPPSEASYIIESTRIGSGVKVSAIDPVTGTEVCISAPLNSSERERNEIAVKKLEYVLQKNKKDV